MSILLKGIEMPTDCDNCLLFDDRFDYPSCNATGHSRGYNWNPHGQRMPDCPLADVREDMDMVDLACWYDENILYPKRIEGKT